MIHSRGDRESVEQIEKLSAIAGVQQFSGGASNLTYLLTFETIEGTDYQLVLRRPPHGQKAASAHDMGREVLIQTALRPSFGLVPEIRGYCEDPGVIGCEFYLMQFLRGVTPRGSARDLGDEVDATKIAQVFIDQWARLHGLRPDEVGLSGLNKGVGYVARQVDGWSKRYQAAHTDDVPSADRLIDWLSRNKPDDSGVSVIHNDWRLDNMVFDFADDESPSLIGVLDWELATVGDPLMDLGASLAYWVQYDDEPGFKSFKRQPSDLPGMPSRHELVRMYEAASGRSVDNWLFYEVFGLFRLAVIVQQIWQRYRSGSTTNPAFSQFGVATNLLIDRAEKLIAAS